MNALKSILVAVCPTTFHSKPKGITNHFWSSKKMFKNPFNPSVDLFQIIFQVRLGLGEMLMSLSNLITVKNHSKFDFMNPYLLT